MGESDKIGCEIAGVGGGAHQPPQPLSCPSGGGADWATTSTSEGGGTQAAQAAPCFGLRQAGGESSQLLARDKATAAAAAASSNDNVPGAPPASIEPDGGGDPAQGAAMLRRVDTGEALLLSLRVCAVDTADVRPGPKGETWSGGLA